MTQIACNFNSELAQHERQEVAADLKAIECDKRADDLYKAKLALLTSDGGFNCWQQINEIDLIKLAGIGRAIRDGDELEVGRMIVKEVTAILRSEAEFEVREAA
jgi:hypothetical protein